jgi:hypothetical protein
MISCLRNRSPPGHARQCEACLPGIRHGQARSLARALWPIFSLLSSPIRVKALVSIIRVAAGKLTSLNSAGGKSIPPCWVKTTVDDEYNTHPQVDPANPAGIQQVLVTSGRNSREQYLTLKADMVVRTAPTRLTICVARMAVRTTSSPTRQVAALRNCPAC